VTQNITTNWNRSDREC